MVEQIWVHVPLLISLLMITKEWEGMYCVFTGSERYFLNATLIDGKCHDNNIKDIYRSSIPVSLLRDRKDAPNPVYSQHCRPHQIHHLFQL